MVTTFNKKDLVSFGNYLLSPERRALFEAKTKDHHDRAKDPDDPLYKTTPQDTEQRLQEVHHSDIENWLEKEKADKKAKKPTPLSHPVRFHLIDIFKELKFGRPAASQNYLDRCIKELEQQEK